MCANLAERWTAASLIHTTNDLPVSVDKNCSENTNLMLSSEDRHLHNGLCFIGVLSKSTFDATSALEPPTLRARQPAHGSVHHAGQPASAWLRGGAEPDSRAGQLGYCL